MDTLLQKFPTKIVGDNEFEMFSKFYQTNKLQVEKWFDIYAKNPVNIKDDSKSKQYRILGNELYLKKELAKCLDCYKSSLCLANFGGENYYLALANRSAAHFDLGDYNKCLFDIELCLEGKYPEHLRPKIYVRKTECLAALGDVELMQKCQADAANFINKIDLPIKDKYLVQLNNVHINESKATKTKSRLQLSFSEHNFDENEKFLFASSSISINQDAVRGRHVVANKRILQGDILFQEKAFIFAPIFTEKLEMVANKCYHCLSQLGNFVLCKFCTLCLYCNESCRDVSWEDCHRFECAGMQINLWHDIGIGFPALKGLLKGIKGGLQCKSNDARCGAQFGNKTDNYMYFNSLLTNISKMENVTPLLLSAAVIVTYLKQKTAFFDWFSEIPQIRNCNLFELVGGSIIRHIAQLSCNSSIIEHWDMGTVENENLCEKVIQVACGIFPSASLMNHSCQPNVTMYFIKDVVVVKALHDLEMGEEIFNCYGIDSRYMAKVERQEACKTLYYFVCSCKICSSPGLEFSIYDSYQCSKCEGPIVNTSSNFGKCLHCGEKASLTKLQSKEAAAKVSISLQSGDLKHIDKIYNDLKSILYKAHKDLQSCLDSYYAYYLKKGDLKLALVFFNKSLKITRTRMGSSSRQVAIEQFQFLDEMVNSVGNALCRDIIIELKVIASEMKRILLLYYHEDQLDLNKIESFVNVQGV